MITCIPVQSFATASPEGCLLLWLSTDNKPDGYENWVAFETDTGKFYRWCIDVWTECGGQAGPQGPKGDQGSAGLNGTDGATGPQGLQGIKGDTGLQGPAGSQGATGADGPQGVKGDTGAQGIQGVQGLPGADGAQGPAGPNLTTSAFGYTTGAGGAVTQATSKTTGVTLNKLSGKITTSNTALAAGAEAKFTVTNNQVAAIDVPVAAISSGGTSGSYAAAVTAVAAGSFDVTLTNLSAGSLSQALVLNFAVIKAAIS